MRLHGIIPPHEPAELTYDLLHDTSNGVITNFIIDLYSSVVKDTSRFQLTAYEQYNQSYISDILDELYNTRQNIINKQYLQRCKAGKMLLEMIAYFEGRWWLILMN